MRINPGLDEGQNGDPRALALADLRATIRKMIERPNKEPDWVLAHELGQSLTPTMAAATVINFAFNKTKRPSTWTIKLLSGVAGYELVLVPIGSKVPKGSHVL